MQKLQKNREKTWKAMTSQASGLSADTKSEWSSPINVDQGNLGVEPLHNDQRIL